jgi:hypothetical protein
MGFQELPIYLKQSIALNPIGSKFTSTTGGYARTDNMWPPQLRHLTIQFMIAAIKCTLVHSPLTYGTMHHWWYFWFLSPCDLAYVLREGSIDCEFFLVPREEV